MSGNKEKIGTDERGTAGVGSSTTRATAATVTPRKRDSADDTEEPVPVPTRKDQFDLVKHLRPIRNVQTDYMSFDEYRFVNYHTECFNSVEDGDNTACWLLLLKVGLPDSMDTYKLDLNKRPKLEPKRRYYRRNYTFANLLSNGNVLVFLEMSVDDQQNNLHYMDNFRIGDQFVAIEPDAVTTYMATSTPILRTDHQFIPAALSPPHKLPVVEVPDIMMLNTSKYFIIHDAIVTFTGLTIVKSSCTHGNMCDFRTPQAKGCCCWRQHSRSHLDGDYVLKANVNVSYSDRFGNFKSLTRVSNWSSQHFTELVLDRRMPLEPLALNQDQVIITAMRRYMKRLEKFVNYDAEEGRRGWTVVGWYKRGMTTDTAGTAQADDKVASAVTKMHLVRLHPTHLTRTELLEGKRLLPAKYLGPHANYEDIKEENRVARDVAEGRAEDTTPETEEEDGENVEEGTT
jgi:hypothetical protein